MAWNVPPVVLPKDGLTSQYLNQYVRDNQLEMLAHQSANNHQIAITTGQNTVQWSTFQTAVKTTTSTTTNTSPVAVGPTMTVTHSGTFLLLVLAELSASNSFMANYAIAPIAAQQTNWNAPVVARACRTDSSAQVSVSCHVVMLNTNSPTNLTGFLWSNSGTSTASVFNSTYTVLPL